MHSKLSLNGYSMFLGLQLALVLFDLFVNSYSFALVDRRLEWLGLFYVAQDLGLVVSLLSLFYGLYTTCVYQAGLIRLLWEKFRTPICVLLVYLVLSVAHHAWILHDHREQQQQQSTTSSSPSEQQSPPLRWSNGLTALWFVQRLVSPFHYYLFKRAALRLSDPRYHENMEWINERLAIK